MTQALVALGEEGKYFCTEVSQGELTDILEVLFLTTCDAADSLQGTGDSA